MFGVFYLVGSPEVRINNPCNSPLETPMESKAGRHGLLMRTFSLSDSWATQLICTLE